MPTDETFAPMVGFVQSYNISVGAAIAPYHIYERRVAQLSSRNEFRA